MSFCDVLVTKVLGTTAITDLIGDRFTPNLIPEQSAYPAVAYTFISDVRESAMGVDAGITTYLVQFDIVDAYSNYTTVRDVGTAFKSELVRWRQTGVQDSFLINGVDNYDHDMKVHRTTLDIKFIVEE